MKHLSTQLRTILIVIFLFIIFGHINAQTYENSTEEPILTSPKTSLKTNLLYDATSSFNLGVEFKLSPKYTLDISANYNPWTFSEGKKLKHVWVQPELRYWTCEPFYGHFFGLHAIYTHYNIAKINIPFGLFDNLEKYRYQGDGYGAGISYGYQWMLSSRWNLEASLGVGYILFDRKKYLCDNCGKFIDKRKEHYFGPTKLGISLIYIIK